MSTRGFVGIGTVDQWEGRYNHWDSYPTGLGADVWATAQRFLQADRHLRGFAARLLGFTNWAQMETGGLCEYCGQKTGHPHSIDGRIYVETHQTTGYPDPQALYHQHDTPGSPATIMTPANTDRLFMEWGYVVDPDQNRLHVLVGGVATPVSYTVEVIRRDGTHKFWPDKMRYTRGVVESLDLGGAEPNWGRIERRGGRFAEGLQADFQKNPDHPLLTPIRALPSVEVWDQRRSAASN